MVTSHLHWQFHAHRPSRFLVILLTKKQRKKQRNRSKTIPRPRCIRGGVKTRKTQTPIEYTKNTLDCDQCNYSSHIVFPTHRPTYWIWSNWKQRHSFRRPRKPHPRSKHEVDRMTTCGDNYGQLRPEFLQMRGRPVGRSSIYSLLLTLNVIDVIYSSRSTLGT